MFTKKKTQTLSRGGFLEVLKIALPLVLSQSCHAMNMFVDRLMLARFSQEAVAASFAAGVTNFTIACFFIGTIVYTGTFVAQYEGANHRERIGQSVWQGIYLALVGGALLATGYYWAQPLFEAFRHEAQVIAEEIRYFRVLSLGGIVLMLSCVLPCFWTGRGKTRFVLGVSFVITLCNIPLNYILIYGKCGLIPRGIVGAALGTILSEGVGVLIYLAAFLHPVSRRHFRTLNCRIDRGLLARMLRFGLPNGINMAVDLVAFNTFALLLGCYGVTIQEATSIAFGINNIAFCPVIGIAMTASILVGQAVGAEKIPLAKKSVRSCLILVTLYNALMIVLFTFFQHAVLAPFIRPGDTAQISSIAFAGTMLYFISGYLFFDGFNMVLSNALRGAGDTRFTMYAMTLAGIFCFALPCVVFYHLGYPWWTLWLTMISDIILLGMIFAVRYKQGAWTKMRVIEENALPDNEKAFQ